MKVAIITDQHFGARNDSTAFLDFYEKFYRDTFFPKLDEEGIKTVLILGDTFDRRKYINFNTLKRAKEMFFNGLIQRNIYTYMLVGNHDVFYKNTNDVNSADLMLNEYTNITVINKPTTMYHDPWKICMIPWICDENREESFKVIKETEAQICMGHLEIAGFSMYRGMPAFEGLERNIFQKFDMTFSGHYHHKSTSDDIYYLGNPYELTWSDYDDPRGFHLFDLETRKLEFVQNPNVMFHKIIYDDKVESITEIGAKDVSKYTGTYVKVVVVNKTNPYMFDRFMEKLYNANPADVTIAEDFAEFSEGVDEDMVDQTKDTLTIIRGYVAALEDDSIDNDRLANMMQELYVEAVNQETS